MNNPIKQVKNEQDFTLNEFGIACDVSITTIHNLLSGEQMEIPDKVSETLEMLGYDSDDIKSEYQQFRKNKREKLLRGE